MVQHGKQRTVPLGDARVVQRFFLLNPKLVIAHTHAHRNHRQRHDKGTAFGIHERILYKISRHFTGKRANRGTTRQPDVTFGSWTNTYSPPWRAGPMCPMYSARSEEHSLNYSHYCASRMPSSA